MSEILAFVCIILVYVLPGIWCLIKADEMEEEAMRMRHAPSEELEELEDLVAQMSDGNEHPEVSWGSLVGKEVVEYEEESADLIFTEITDRLERLKENDK